MPEDNKKLTLAEALKADVNKYLYVIVGGLIYSIFMNLFIVPIGTYAGGFMGVAQIIRTLLTQNLGVNTGQTDIAGIISFVMNVPLFLFALRSIGKMYLFRSAICIASETLFLVLIPVPIEPIISDTLVGVIIGGIGCGLGGGLVLRGGSSGGGLDLIGTLLIKKNNNLKMSTVSNTFNVLVYGTMLFLFNVDTVVYSIIYSVVYVMAVDKVFIQNINVEMHIITNSQVVTEMQKEVFKKLNRGITKWSAIGGYTGAHKEIVYVIVNKYEVQHLIWIVRKYDKSALIIENSGVRVNGNFLKKVE